MASDTLPEPPAQLKAIQGYMRVASDVERVDPVVAYWVRLYSIDLALTIDKESLECKNFLSSVIVWLENYKKAHKDNEAVSNQTVGQAHVENFIMSLFTKADNLDRAGTANKTTIRMFYMAALLFESMAVFGPLTEDVTKRAKYAKFKAAYITKCLKTGETPHPGPMEGGESLDDIPGIGSVTSNEPPQEGTGAKSDPFVMTPSVQPPYPKVTNLPQAPMQPTSSTDPGKPNSSANNQVEKSLPPSAPSPASTTSHPTTGSTIHSTRFNATNGAPLKPEDLLQGQKYCKFANSALQYDDIPTAVANLEKALRLLTTGQRSE